jgi:alpha-D-xyloside xylohydrolase
MTRTTYARVSFTSVCLFLCVTAPSVHRAWAQDTVHVATTFMALDFFPSSGMLVLKAGSVEQKAPGVSLDGVPQRGFTQKGGIPLRFENSDVGVNFEVLGRREIAATWTAHKGGDHTFEFRLHSDDATQYYGTGERFNALNQRGYLLPMTSDDRYGNKGVGSHKPVPFVMSTRGYGIWVDSFAPGEFDLDATARFGTVLRFSTDTLRVVFIGGPRLADILESFTGLTGRSRVPPPWAFGLWKSRDVHPNQDSVMVDTENLRRFGIPASVIVLDSPWETGYNTFEVNPRQFSDPPEMFRRIDQLGFRLCLWLTPFINQANITDMTGIPTISADFEKATQYLVKDRSGAVALMPWWKGTGGLVDFTDPKATRWWQEQLMKTKAYGAHAFKADDGEGNFVPDAVFHDTSRPAIMKNRYSILYNQALQEYVDRELDGDGVLITRSGYTGTQQYPFAWAGDNHADFSFSDGLPSVILAAQNAALSGIALWGSDIAGYAGTPTKELFIRWTQQAVFTPFMQVHMTSNLGPWDFDQETLDIFRKFAVLRTQLFPYLYQAVHEASQTGIPVIRPMVLAFQEDPGASQHVFQYMFGPDLLVAPVYQPGTFRTVYLPRGRWYNFWDGTPHEGPTSVEVNAPLDRLPLFVRAGAIIPMVPADVQTLVLRHERTDSAVSCLDNRRILQVWQGESGGLTTWDGLTATIRTLQERTEMVLSASPARPVEVRLMFCRPKHLKSSGGKLKYDSGSHNTSGSFNLRSGAVTMSWSKQG